ncbi:hypothetical protein ULMS_16280 [Patiriisocius marinistellae]|uniref:RDD domain-containing protein n=1 Tax=Patiriisocius marinistellae TaxID=2494560 RepID=A0A5J4FVR7_9FLAO|nr:RDD family protein [Patiriisocius marinistellae]GEQ86120.1 hypothetical protein ULMS_16280 [Patiriisocius marinistellae]
MNRQEHLQFCNVCTHKKFDRYKGTVCNLTDERADFDVSCPHFAKDNTLADKELTYVSNLAKMDLATTGTRFGNYIIDLIIMLLLQLGFGIALGVVLGLIAPDTINSISESSRISNYILGGIFSFLYYTFFEHAYGQSIGKMLTKTKVVDLNGEKPTLSIIAKRSLCRLIPFEAFSFLGDDSVGWHDTISDTRVVYIKNETE